MNTGQMLLVLCAAVLFATAGLTIGDVLLESDRVSLESRTGSLAVSIAHEAVTDRLALPFDSLSLGSVVDTISTPFAAFVCSTHIGFVSDADPNATVGGPTAFKRISVSVGSSYTPGPLTLVAIACDL